MSVIDTLLSDIDAAVRGTGERRRHALLRKTTATLIDCLPDLSEHDLSIFDDVLLSLTLDVESETRAELSDRLADLHRIPKKTLRALALDDAISVARPLIERSSCLDDDILIAIVSKKSADFLNLVAKRRGLSKSIIDHLVTHADDALLVDLISNKTNDISDTALRILAERSLSHPPLYRILRSRPDLAMRHIGALIEAARYRAKSDAITRNVNDDMLSRALALETAEKIAKTSQLSLASAASSSHLKKKDRSNLNEMLEREQIDDALVALAADAGISTDAVKRVFHVPQHEPLMFLLRAQNYPLSTVINFMRLKNGSMSSEFEAQINDAYCALARETASRIASFITDKKPISNEDNEPLRHSA